MSNENNAATHFDLHTTGVGYLNRAREVKPQSGKKFKPFWSVGISALHENIDDVEYSRIDTIIVGTDACELIKQYKEDINQQDSRVICGFKVGDIYTDPYNNNDGEDRAVIKGRLLYISWIKVNGEMVYNAEKPQTKLPDTNPQQQESTANNDGTTQNCTSSVECPFIEKNRKTRFRHTHIHEHCKLLYRITRGLKRYRKWGGEARIQPFSGTI
jgi:hypothetical protein